jgi:hypothetical protein
VCWKLGIGILDFIYRRHPKEWSGLQEDRMESLTARSQTFYLSASGRADAVRELKRIYQERLFRKKSLLEICVQELAMSTGMAYFLCPDIACKITERFLQTGRSTAEVRQEMAAWNKRRLAQERKRTG